MQSLCFIFSFRKLPLKKKKKHKSEVQQTCRKMARLVLFPSPPSQHWLFDFSTSSVPSRGWSIHWPALFIPLRWLVGPHPSMCYASSDPSAVSHSDLTGTNLLRFWKGAEIETTRPPRGIVWRTTRLSVRKSFQVQGALGEGVLN